MKTIKIEDVKIPDYMLQHTPSESKYNKKLKKYESTHEYKPIVVNKENYLMDGYITYLILKAAGVEDVNYYSTNHGTLAEYEKSELSYRNNPTVYVEGVHLNPEHKKVYMWRVTNSFIENNHIMDERELIGKYALAQTKFGLSPIKILNVKYLDKCPVQGQVKKIVKIMDEG